MRALICGAFAFLLVGTLSQIRAQTTDLSAASSTPELERRSTVDGLALDDVIDRIIAREHYENQLLTYIHPLMETRIQDTKLRNGEQVPWRSWDLQGRARISASALSVRPLPKTPATLYRQTGFLQEAFVDRTDFDRSHYTFVYVGRDNNDLVFDVRPLREDTGEHFSGQIWVEPVNYTIVRFNGTYTSQPHWEFLPTPHKVTPISADFDSQRTNSQADIWLPSVVTTRRTGMFDFYDKHWDFTARTTFSDYAVSEVRIPPYEQQRFQTVLPPKPHLGASFWVPWAIDAGLVITANELLAHCLDAGKCVNNNPIWGTKHPGRPELYGVQFGVFGMELYLARKNRLQGHKFLSQYLTYIPLFTNGWYAYHEIDETLRHY